MGGTKRIIKAYLLCLAMVAILLSINACGNDKPIKIGFIAGLSGRVADLGVSGRNGVMLAIEQQNKKGGINGRSLLLVAKDDKQDSETAKSAVKDLLGQKVDVIIGPMTSSVAMSVVPLVNQSDIFMVSPTVTTTDLLDRDDHFLRVISSTKDYAEKSATYQFKVLNNKTAVAIFDERNKAYTKSWLDNFSQVFQNLGGSILAVESFRSGNDTVFHHTVAKLMKNNPELFVIISNAVDAALICQQIRKINPGTTIAMSEWASTERLIELAGTAAEGAYIAQFLDRNDRAERYQLFRKAFMDRFGREPGFAGIAGFDAATVVFAALTGQKSSESLKEALIRIGQFECVQQKIHINRFGDADRSTFITRIENGKYITIE